MKKFPFSVLYQRQRSPFYKDTFDGIAWQHPCKEKLNFYLVYCFCHNQNCMVAGDLSVAYSFFSIPFLEIFVQKRSIIFSILFAMLFLGFVSTATRAQVFNETQALDFGEWFIINNSSSYQVTVLPNGAFSNSPQITMLQPPVPGIYNISGLPPFATILSVDVVMSAPLSAGGADVFTMDNFQTIIPNADGAGNTTLNLGARANTSGSGNFYPNATYTGTLDVTINF